MSVYKSKDGKSIMHCPKSVMRKMKRQRFMQKLRKFLRMDSRRDLSSWNGVKMSEPTVKCGICTKDSQEPITEALFDRLLMDATTGDKQ